MHQNSKLMSKQVTMEFLHQTNVAGKGFKYYLFALSGRYRLYSVELVEKQKNGMLQ